MPKAEAPKGVAAKSSPTEASSPDNSIPRLKLGESGFVGLKTRNGRIQEEAQLAFRYPHFLATRNEMVNNPTIGAALNIHRFFMERVNWAVQHAVGATPVEIERSKLIESMMHDMEHSWSAFISSVIPVGEYGFALNEIVLRRRLKRNNSLWDDGLVGLAKLPVRAQDTIAKWKFSEDGSELLGIKQTTIGLENQIYWQGKTDAEDGLLFTPIDKLLHFTTNCNKGNPEGKSSLQNVYLAYKQLTLIQETQLLGIGKDQMGILKIEIPPRYLDPNGSVEDKAAVAGFQQIIDNYNNGVQRGLLVPAMADAETKLPMFSYSLMEAKGTAKYDTEAAIKRLEANILTALNVDPASLGVNSTGSAASKTSITALAVDSKLKEIANVLNHKLMKVLHEANGWSTDNMPSFVYDAPEEFDIGEYSSAIQRIFATSAIECDRSVYNRIRRILGMPLLPDDLPVQVDMLPAVLTGQTSASATGMAIGNDGNSGTSKGGGSGADKSIANKENR
jgi:hypothetical protein